MLLVWEGLYGRDHLLAQGASSLEGWLSHPEWRLNKSDTFCSDVPQRWKLEKRFDRVRRDVAAVAAVAAGPKARSQRRDEAPVREQRPNPLRELHDSTRAFEAKAGAL